MNKCPRGKQSSNGRCVARINIKKYLGTWHEQGSTPLWFSRGCTETTANYSLDEQGNMNVRNRCIADGRQKESNGKAYKTDELNLLRVGFFPSKNPIFKADYRVEYIDDFYKNAIVTSGKSVWILTRQKEIKENDYKKLIRKAESLSISTSRVRRTEQ